MSKRINQMPVKLYREHKIQQWRTLKAKGLKDADIAQVIKISRATYYRWSRKYDSRGLHGLMPQSRAPHNHRTKVVLSNSILAQIRALREQYPYFGKVKIHALCMRQGMSISLSSVGRALHYLMHRGIIMPVPLLKCRTERKAVRKFTNSYAQRLPKYHKSPIQLDHTIINLRGAEHRVFVAYDRNSKFTLCKSYKHATSANAANFLEYVITRWPYKPTELQVDGGSEFRANFEQACLLHNIKLFVLPPRSPQLNGGVERFNQTLQDECFLPGYHTLPTTTELLNTELEKWIKYYNEIRPHRSLLDPHNLPMPPIAALNLSHM